MRTRTNSRQSTRMARKLAMASSSFSPRAPGRRGAGETGGAGTPPFPSFGIQDRRVPFRTGVPQSFRVA